MKKQVVYLARNKKPNFLMVYSEKPKRDNSNCCWIEAKGKSANLSYKQPLVPWDECSDSIPGFEDLTWEDEPIAVEIHVIKEKTRKDSFVEKVKELGRTHEKEEGVPVTLRCKDDIWSIDDKSLKDLYTHLLRGNDDLDIEFYGEYDDEAVPIDHGIAKVDGKITYY